MERAPDDPRRAVTLNVADGMLVGDELAIGRGSVFSAPRLGLAGVAGATFDFGQ